eukprot:2863131-Heterocapsa_arctica.AAC.1
MAHSETHRLHFVRQHLGDVRGRGPVRGFGGGSGRSAITRCRRELVPGLQSQDRDDPRSGR